MFSVTSVQYCLCVSRIQCTQCSVSVYSVGSESMASVQFLKRSVYRVESVAYIVSGVHAVLAGLQSTTFIVCLLLFSVGSVQSSIQLSEGFRICSVQCL